jgi:uncharacterized repeat protein (TIGR03803 family)
MGAGISVSCLVGNGGGRKRLDHDRDGAALLCRPPTDGWEPASGLIFDSSGNLYGTTIYGGSGQCRIATGQLPGCGTVFKITPDGTETVLHSFAGGATDGQFPEAGLLADSSGNLYGTTQSGGAEGLGTVFKITPDGTETVLHFFAGGPSDGSLPNGSLIADSQGNLYGTTAEGGAVKYCVPGCGTVFKLTDTGFTVATPFAAFKPELKIDLDKKPSEDAFLLEANFTLGKTSNGIHPDTEQVSLQIGGYSVTIPPHSFKGHGFGPFTFKGVIQGSDLAMIIEPNGTKRYALEARGQDVNLQGTKNPMSVTLTIGDNDGRKAVNAKIEH